MYQETKYDLTLVSPRHETKHYMVYVCMSKMYMRVNPLQMDLSVISSVRFSFYTEHVRSSKLT